MGIVVPMHLNWSRLAKIGSSWGKKEAKSNYSSVCSYKVLILLGISELFHMTTMVCVCVNGLWILFTHNMNGSMEAQ